MMTLNDCLCSMHRTYVDDPMKAVRGQGFIKELHRYCASQLRARLNRQAKARGIQVVEEATLYGSHKPKDVDVAVIDPTNGPLLVIGVRSQMSSVGKNVLTYYEGIIGECISLQDRFPMAVCGYIYLHPLRPVMLGREDEIVDHRRYAQMYEAITGRAGLDYKTIRGIYDQFAYMVVDFEQNPPELRDDVVQSAVPDTDLRMSTFVERMIATFEKRNLFLDFFS